jgi:hypothetical protein
METLLTIDPGFRALLPTLAPEELVLLEHNLIAEGCREPLVTWAADPKEPPIILDGHNRYEICTRKKLSFKTVPVVTCQNREQALAWIVANQLGRRNLTPGQKAPIGLELEKQLTVEAKKRQLATLKQNQSTVPQRIAEREKGEAREQAAAMLGINRQYITDAKKVAQAALLFSLPCQGRYSSLFERKKEVDMITETEAKAILGTKVCTPYSKDGVPKGTPGTVINVCPIPIDITDMDVEPGGASPAHEIGAWFVSVECDDVHKTIITFDEWGDGRVGVDESTPHARDVLASVANNS